VARNGSYDPRPCKPSEKMNSHSSTEAKMVGVNDLMGQVSWNRLFLEAQVHVESNNIIFRDKKVPYCYKKMGMHHQSNLLQI